MKNLFQIIGLLLITSTTLLAQNTTPFFDAADVFFSKEVKNGVLDYTGLKSNTQ